MKSAYISSLIYCGTAKQTEERFYLWSTAEIIIQPMFPRMAKDKLPRLQPQKCYVYQETFTNLSKSMVCCNLSVVRGTQSPESIECTTFGSRLNP